MPTGMQLALANECMFCSDFEGEDEHVYGLCESCREDCLTSCDSCGDYLSRMGSDSLREFAARERALVARTPSARNNYTMFWSTARPVDTQDSYDELCEHCTFQCSGCHSRWQSEEESWSCCGSSMLNGYAFKPAYQYWYLRNSNAVSDWTAIDGQLFMGVEIEVERARPHVDRFMQLAGEDDADSPEFIYAKTDGSLGMDGVEFVTMPATLAAFDKMMPWSAFEALHASGARAWAYPSCGMHIHLSRSAFSPSHMWKFLKFHGINSRWLAQYAGRDHSTYASWSNSTMDNAATKPSVLVKGDGGYDRYGAVNMLPRTTIELRYFRSNIMKDGILRNVQLADAIFQFTAQTSYTDVLRGHLAWWKFVDWCTTRPEYALVVSHVRSNNITGE